MTESGNSDQYFSRSKRASEVSTQRPEQQFITLPRWLVYFQAAMLGIVATTFFLFGLMVGSLTTPSISTQVNTDSQPVRGNVSFKHQGQSYPDAGAVAILMPDSVTDINRFDPTTIRPGSFEPLENPLIEWLRQQGGDVVRTNIRGDFEVFAQPGKYQLLVISKSAETIQDAELSRDQVATLSQFFLPVEKLIENKRFDWRSISIASKPTIIPDIEFQ
jgi:hypothetical protein